MKTELHPQFIAHMNAANDVADDQSDSAWWAMMEEAAREFKKQHKLRDDCNDLVHEWLGLAGE